MGRTARNQLSLTPISDGRWLLSGYIFGRQYRRRGTDIAKLTALKSRLEQQVLQEAHPREELRLTWLTADQLRDAEASAGRAGDRSLLSCVIAAETVLGTGARVPCHTALDSWLAALTERKRFDSTLAKNRLRIGSFLDHSGARDLQDITDRMIDRWVFRRGTADYTRVTDAGVVGAWLTWCVRRRLLARNPFDLDMKDLKATARTLEPPRIANPAQCDALLAAAAAHAAGRMLPYTILTTWCFLRPAEAQRTLPADLLLDRNRPVVRVMPRKRGTVSYRVVDIPPCVLGLLRACLERGLCDPVTPRRRPRRKNQPPAPPPAPGLFFSKTMWETIRARAGLITLGRTTRGKRRPITGGIWQPDLLRHTGISYLYQHTGEMKEVCRQAGNSDDTAFRHYIDLAEEGASARFYAEKPVALPPVTSSAPP